MERFRILAVDDDLDTLELIRMTLKDEFDVLTLSNPMDIYEYIEIFEPDLLLLDIMMPKLTGFQVIELLSKNPRFRTIPIIILSAKDSVREIKYGYKLGVKLYLTKPFQTERLTKNVKMVLSENPARKNKTFTLAQAITNIQIKKSYKIGTSSSTNANAEITKSHVDIGTQTKIPSIPKMSFIPNAPKKSPEPEPAKPEKKSPEPSPSNPQEDKKDQSDDSKEKTWVG